MILAYLGDSWSRRVGTSRTSFHSASSWKALEKPTDVNSSPLPMAEGVKNWRRGADLRVRGHWLKMATAWDAGPLCSTTGAPSRD